MHLHSAEGPSTTERLLAAAAQIIAERGYAATTTRAIAEQAGVNEVTLFRQFGSKQGLIRALGASFSQAENPYVIAPDVDDIRAALHEIAERERHQVTAVGLFAARVVMDAAVIPEVAEVLDSEIGPRSNLKHVAQLFRTWQETDRLRADLSAELLAENFLAATSGMLMTRSILGLPGEPSDIHLCVDLWCDATLKENP